MPPPPTQALYAMPSHSIGPNGAIMVHAQPGQPLPMPFPGGNLPQFLVPNQMRAVPVGNPAPFPAVTVWQAVVPAIAAGPRAQG